MLLIPVCQFCLPVALNAQTVKVNNGNTKEPITDYHVVQPGETLYSLSKKYQTTVAALMELNPEIVNNYLPSGEKIKVPAMAETIVANAAPAEGNAILHTVQKKETLYSLGKRYHTTVENLLFWNNLQDPAIEEGAVLIVGYESAALSLEGPLTVTAPEMIKPDENVPASMSKPHESGQAITGEAQAFPDELAIKGVATWVKSPGDEADMFALHPTAAKGTEVMVKNMMNGKTVTVKVIGKLPATSENENVMIKISGAAAGKLGVLDDRFLAAIYFEGINEINSYEGNAPKY